MFYRDGISEGQYDQVRKYEVPQIKIVLRELFEQHRDGIPKLIVLSSQMRHQTRFYATHPDDWYSTESKKENRNLRPGLYVDKGVTYRDRWDFWLQPHASPIGTAKPAHYVVLENETDLSEAEVVNFVSTLTQSAPILDQPSRTNK